MNIILGKVSHPDGPHTSGQSSLKIPLVTKAKMRFFSSSTEFRLFSSYTKLLQELRFQLVPPTPRSVKGPYQFLGLLCFLFTWLKTKESHKDTSLYWKSKLQIHRESFVILLKREQTSLTSSNPTVLFAFVCFTFYFWYTILFFKLYQRMFFL